MALYTAVFAKRRQLHDGTVFLEPWYTALIEAKDITMAREIAHTLHPRGFSRFRVFAGDVRDQHRGTQDLLPSLQPEDLGLTSFRLEPPRTPSGRKRHA